jgi:hypothetical protein
LFRSKEKEEGSEGLRSVFQHQLRGRRGEEEVFQFQVANSQQSFVVGKLNQNIQIIVLLHEDFNLCGLSLVYSSYKYFLNLLFFFSSILLFLFPLVSHFFA